jgi:hypothetical protein
MGQRAGDVINLLNAGTGGLAVHVGGRDSATLMRYYLQS